jgi:two-component system, chemotaxis family, sensor kinase CheA
MTEPQLIALAHLTEKVATELVFAKPGGDDALLPVNSFVCEMEELCGALPAASDLTAAIAKARALVDGILSSSGNFTEHTLALLNAWTRWMSQLIVALRAGGPVPEFIQFARLEDCAESMRLKIGADRELLSEFAQEAREHLQAVEAGAFALESDPTNIDGLHSIFRAFHSVKGGAGFLDLKQVSRLTHEVESLLDSARTGRTRICAEFIEVILAATDTLKTFFDDIEAQLRGESGSGPIALSTDRLIKRIGEMLAGVAARELDQTEFFERVPLTETAHFAHAPSASASILKVDVRKIDSLMELIAELNASADAPDLDRERLQRVARGLHKAVNSLRIVSLRATFTKMARLTRDLAVREGKPIEIETRGEEIELDRAIVEQLSDTLIHMIRNAVDHAIETPEQREKRGKNPAGQIHLSAERHDGFLVARLSDDGQGLNKKRILEKAIARNLVRPDAQLSDREVYELIFNPGFSTADRITDLSGRGVGMDIVQRNIARLRGRIEIETKEGRGTAFSIFIPLSIKSEEETQFVAGEGRRHERWSRRTGIETKISEDALFEASVKDSWS